jgi:hypothetical protein
MKIEKCEPIYELGTYERQYIRTYERKKVAQKYLIYKTKKSPHQIGRFVHGASVKFTIFGDLKKCCKNDFVYTTGLQRQKDNIVST